MATLVFEDWVKKFERIGIGTPAWNAFQLLVNRLTELKSRESGAKPEWLKILDIDEDRGWSEGVRRYVLRLMYRLTSPPLTYPDRKLKQDAHTRQRLKSLTKEAEGFVTYLRKHSVWVTNDAKEYEVDLSPLLQVYETAAGYSRQLLKVLERPYTHEPALSDHFSGFLGILDRYGVAEPESLALLRFALLTHGYDKDELEELINRTKIRDGKFRKRKKAVRSRVASFVDLALAAMAKWDQVNPFTCS
jgi:hypothetical protein